MHRCFGAFCAVFQEKLRCRVENFKKWVYNTSEVKYMTYEQIRQDEAVKTYIRHADATLDVLGFTEHSFAHVGVVAEMADRKSVV